MSYAFNIPFSVERKVDTMNGIADGTVEKIVDNTSTKILAYSFFARDGLKSVSIPNSVDIGSTKRTWYGPGFSFQFCISLESIDLPNVETMYGQYNFGLNSGSDSGALTKISLPKLKNLSGRTFFYRDKLETVELPSLNTVDGMIYDFYGCNRLLNVYMTSLQSSVALATKTSSGGFPWGAGSNCIFHFADGNFDRNGNPV